MWRDEDEALLNRLERAHAVEVGWRRLSADPPPSFAPRFSVLLPPLSSAAAPEDILLAAAADRSLAAPSEVHVRARLASVLGGAAAPRGVDRLELRVNAVVLWAYLRSEGAYLESLAQTVSQGDEFSAADITRAVTEASEHPLRGLLKSFRESLLGDRQQSRALAHALESLDAALTRPEIDSALAERWLKLRDQRRREVIEAALVGIADAFEDGFASLNDQAVQSAMRDVMSLWRDTAHSVIVERFVALRTADYCWGALKGDRHPALRAFNDTVAPLVDSLAVRVASDPTLLPLASRAAQLLVFRAELLPNDDLRAAPLAQALRTCPTHRNSRLLYACLLARRALSRVGGKRFVAPRQLESARQEAQRAFELWPHAEPVMTRAQVALRGHGVTVGPVEKDGSSK